MAPQPSPAAFFDKVELRTERDWLKVEQLLDEAVDAYLKAKGDAAPEGLKIALRQASGNVTANIMNFVTFSEYAGGENAPLHTPGAPPRSPMLPPLSPPPVDAEVLALEADVEAASKRVAAMRTTMQAQLQDALAAKLAQCRPTAGALPPQPGSNAALEGTAAEAAPPSPRAEELQQRLAEVAGRVPSVRGRLEDANERLQRVLAAVAQEATRPAPNTVERVVMGRTTPVAVHATSAAAGADQSLDTALRTGQISTRRGRGEVRPVPYVVEGDEEEKERRQETGDV